MYFGSIQFWPYEKDTIVGMSQTLCTPFTENNELHCVPEYVKTHIVTSWICE